MVMVPKQDVKGFVSEGGGILQVIIRKDQQFDHLHLQISNSLNALKADS